MPKTYLPEKLYNQVLYWRDQFIEKHMDQIKSSVIFGVLLLVFGAMGPLRGQNFHTGKLHAHTAYYPEGGIKSYGYYLLPDYQMGFTSLFHASEYFVLTEGGQGTFSNPFIEELDTSDPNSSMDFEPFDAGPPDAEWGFADESESWPPDKIPYALERGIDLEPAKTGVWVYYDECGAPELLEFYDMGSLLLSQRPTCDCCSSGFDEMIENMSKEEWEFSKDAP